MPETHYVDIENMEYIPDSLPVERGDSVIWVNYDGTDHTATSRQLVDGEPLFNVLVRAGQDSDPLLIDWDIPEDGLEYYCTFPHNMEAKLVQADEDSKKRLHQLADIASRVSTDDVFTEDDWRSIGQIVAANWVYDLGSDFVHALSRLDGDQKRQVAEAWDGIQDWWRSYAGTERTDLTRDDLMTHSQRVLEQYAQKLRAAWVRLGPLVVKHPNPDPLNLQIDAPPEGWGQSQDPFGKSFTVLPRPANDESQWTEVGRAFLLRVNPYSMKTYYNFIEKLEQGLPITEQDRREYTEAKAKVSALDYQILAAHQSQGLTAFWGTNEYNAEEFAKGMWRMTFNGDWQSSERALWHWLRFIDLYLPVKGRSPSARLPDLLEVSLSAVELYPRWAPGMYGLARHFD